MRWNCNALPENDAYFKENRSINGLHPIYRGILHTMRADPGKVFSWRVMQQWAIIWWSALLCGSHAWSARRVHVSVLLESAHLLSTPALLVAMWSNWYVNLMGCFAAGDHAPRARSLTKRELAARRARSLSNSLLYCFVVGPVSHRDRPSDVAWCCCCVCLCSAAAAAAHQHHHATRAYNLEDLI